MAKAKNRRAAFDKLLAEINDRYGSNSVMRAKDASGLANQRRIPIGIFALDVAWGGGFPIGKMVTLVGEYSSGKSLIAYRAAAAFQRQCRVCGRPMFAWDELAMKATRKRCCRDPEPMRVVWFDAERAWINTWAKRMGVNIDDVYIIRTEYAEQGIDVADSVIRSGECDLLVVDSVAALTPSIEIQESAEKWQMGVHARLMNKAMRKWTSAQSSKGDLGRILACSIILVNQVRLKIGVVYGDPRTSPGGKGIDFFTSIKCDVKAKGVVEIDGMPAGHSCEVVVTKNKTAPPRRTALFEMSFLKRGHRARGSTDYAMQVLMLATFWKVVRLNGAFYSLAKGVKIQGKEQAAAFLEMPENAKLLDWIAKKVWKKEVAWLDGTLDDTVESEEGDEEEEDEE